jgi:acetyl esterase
MVWFWDHYLGPDQDGTEPYAAPLLASDLAGLPPATIVTARYDPLLDDGRSYAERLRAAGVPVEYRTFDDQSHGFFWMAGALAGARDLADYLGHRLRELDAG